MNTREELLNIVKKILIGPNPLPDYNPEDREPMKLQQENGEEILFFDSPLKTYVTECFFRKQSLRMNAGRLLFLPKTRLT
jgi:hypothetical protein